MGNSSDSSTKGNLFDLNMFFLLVAIVFLLGRTWMDVFILTVNFRDWMKKKRLSTTDRILTLQGSIRICVQSISMSWFIVAKGCPWVIQRGYSLKVYVLSSWYFISCNVWLTASLCSYYCVKIADFSHPFFIHLKRKLSGLESAWLVGSAVLALGSSLPFVNIDLEIRGTGNPFDFFQSKNLTEISHPMMAFHISALLGLGYVAAFSICAISAALLLFSLWRHRQRMLGSWGSHRSPQTDAHFKALVTILLLVINSVIAFICVLVLLFDYFRGGSIFYVVASVVLDSCFTVESLITIWGNKKLKNELCRSINFAKCRGCIC